MPPTGLRDRRDAEAEDELNAIEDAIAALGSGMVGQKALLRDFSDVMARMAFVDPDKLIPPEYKKLVAAAISYRATMSRTSGEHNVMQMNPFQCHPRVRERWSYHRYFDDETHIQLRKIYLAAISHKYIPSGPLSSIHFVREASFFRELLELNFDSAELELPTVYHKVADDAPLAALEVTLPMLLRGQDAPHVVLDLGTLGLGRIRDVLARRRGIARAFSEGRVSFCCSANVCRQQLFIVDTKSEAFSAFVRGLSTSGTKPDIFTARENILDFVTLRTLSEFFPGFPVPPHRHPAGPSTCASSASLDATPPVRPRLAPPLCSLTDLMVHVDCLRFFSAGPTSAHTHVRFFVEAFRQMIFELRRLRCEDAFAKDENLGRFLSDTLSAMLVHMQGMCEEGGDSLELYFDRAASLKGEINILALMAPSYYGQEAWDACQDQLMPHLSRIRAGVTWPRFYYDISGFNGAVNILASLWRQRGRRELRIGFSKWSYFEFGLRFPPRMVYRFDAAKGAFDRDVPDGGLDLFVVEPHRSYSNEMVSGVYIAEDMIKQVEGFYAQNLLSGRFTIIIDNTIDYIASDALFDFVQHWAGKIAAGEMCVIALRSAQKYDMLGFDDFQGGISTVFCTDPACFDEEEIARIHRASVGESAAFHGLTFYHIACREQQDRYRRAIFMSNHMCNQALKRELGSRVSLIEYSKFPLKITLAEDDTLCCVDFRADTESIIHQFADALEGAGFVSQRRPNFGFAIASWFIWTDFQPPRSFGRLSMGFNTAADLRRVCDTWVAFNRSRISPPHTAKTSVAVVRPAVTRGSGPTSPAQMGAACSKPPRQSRF